jgi:hypothetical protein
MWRLFPKSWFPSQGRNGSAMAVAAEQFAMKWPEYLVAALSEVLDRDDLSVEEAMALLPSLDTKDLLSVDRAMRHSWRLNSDIPNRARPPSVTPLEDPIEGAAHLFTASWPSNTIRGVRRWSLR